VIAKNAASNVIRGGATAIVAVLLPHFMAQNLARDRFAAWSLILQIASYASFLDFGLQISVARYIAQALELQDNDRPRKLLGTALMLLSGAGLLAIATSSVALLFAPSLFAGIPKNLMHEFQLAAFVMVMGAALQLPFSAYSGVLIGMQRNDLPALAIGSSRLVGAVAAAIASRYTHSLVVFAFCIGIPNLLGGIFQLAAVRRLHGRSVTRHRLIDLTLAIELLRYCGGLSVWSLSMLLISGLDVTIVGHFDFAAVGPYAIASTITTIQASGNSSIMNAFLAPFAAMHSQRRFNQVRSLVVRSTRVNSFLNVVLLAATLDCGKLLMRVWVGQSYSARAYGFLIALMVSQTIRLCWTSYSIALMATNHQNECIIPALVEGVVNLGMSLWAVKRFGAIGVAFGSIAGAAAAIPTLLILTIYSRSDLPITRRDLIIDGVFPGIMPAAPLLICALLTMRGTCGLAPMAGLWFCALVVAAALARKFLRIRDETGFEATQ
jgi:O-antigen/teichoic acid export membrane protein